MFYLPKFSFPPLSLHPFLAGIEKTPNIIITSLPRSHNSFFYAIICDFSSPLAWVSLAVLYNARFATLRFELFIYFELYFLDGGKSPLQVLAWPYRGRPGKVNIQRDSPDSNTWIRAQVHVFPFI